MGFSRRTKLSNRAWPRATSAVQHGNRRAGPPRTTPSESEGLVSFPRKSSSIRNPTETEQFTMQVMPEETVRRPSSLVENTAGRAIWRSNS